MKYCYTYLFANITTKQNKIYQIHLEIQEKMSGNIKFATSLPSVLLKRNVNASKYAKITLKTSISSSKT